MIPAYNCSNYLAETIQSVLQQDMGEGIMQIEVVDDCSTDANVEELVNTIGKGRVSYFKQEKNVGSLRNFETCINRSRGIYIHLLHGDDRVKNGYYSAITDLFERFPNSGAAYCAYDYINTNGSFTHHSRVEATEPCILDNWLYKLAEYPRVEDVAMTVKRETYETLGSFYLAHYGEDWEMWARIAKDYPTAYVPEFLAEYREHENSITWRSYQSGQNITDIKKIIAVIISYLPKKDQPKMLRTARKNYAYWILNETFNGWFRYKNKKLAYNQIITILGMYWDSYTIARAALLLLHIWTDPYRAFLKRP
ncbi:MAG: glycosyltransferase [Clostridiaceae bacterium]|nr:glycosyltransferase [Clostridiaceae bacterium]